jgi:hypothetical protein
MTKEFNSKKELSENNKEEFEQIGLQIQAINEKITQIIE